MRRKKIEQKYGMKEMKEWRDGKKEEQVKKDRMK